MKKYLIVIILFIIAQSVVAQENKRKLEISLSKNTYLVHEPIWLDVNFKNVSNDSIPMSWICLECRDGSLEVELTDSQGKIYEYSGIIWNVSHGDISMHKYEPHEGIFTTYNLIETNGIGGDGSLSSMSLPPGKYTIRLCRGSNCSELLNFEVIEPFGSEKEALKLLLEGFHSTHFKKYKKRVELLKIVIEDYSNSVYAPKALMLIGAYPTQEEAKEILNVANLQIELLQRYPNSGYNFGLIRGLGDNRFPPEEVEIINSTINEHKNNRIGKLLKQMLEDKQIIKNKKQNNY